MYKFLKFMLESIILERPKTNYMILGITILEQIEKELFHFIMIFSPVLSTCLQFIFGNTTMQQQFYFFLLLVLLISF